jgi:hypothetical protein
MTKSLATIIHEQILHLMELEELGGEITVDLEEAMQITDRSLAEKVDNYAALITRLDSEIKYYDELTEQFAAKSETYSKIRERLRYNLKDSMGKIGANQLSGNYFEFKLARSTPKLVIEDESLIPNEFKIVETITKIDNAKLKQALKTSTIQGAKLEETYSLRQGMAKKLAIE